MFGIILGALSVVAAALTVGRLAINIAKDLGLVRSTTNVEELGEKVLVANNREEGRFGPEDFESYEGYVRALEAFEIEPEEAEQFSVDEKQQMGASLAMHLIEENYGKDLKVGDFIINEVPKNESFYTPDRVKSYIEVFDAARESMSHIKDYFEGKIMDASLQVKTEDLLVSAERKMQPELTEDQSIGMIEQHKR